MPHSQHHLYKIMIEHDWKCAIGDKKKHEYENQLTLITKSATPTLQFEIRQMCQLSKCARHLNAFGVPAKVGQQGVGGDEVGIKAAK